MCDTTPSGSSDSFDEEGRYTVQGMTCSACAVRVTDALTAVPGVERSDVDLASGTVKVSGEYDATQVLAAIAGAGYRVA